MTMSPNADGASAPGQNKPQSIQLHIRQPIVIAALVAGAGLALLTNTRASAPEVEKTEARASLELITSQLPALAFTVPQDLKVDPNLQTAVAAPKDLVPVTRFVAAPATTSSVVDMPPAALLHEASQTAILSPALQTQADPQPLPPKVKGAFPRGLHPVIKHSMVEASRFLPEGWQLEFMNALRDAPGVWNGPHGKRDKTGGALAVDVWLVNPKGERLCNFKCTQHFETYQTFMQMVKHIQDRDFPAYKSQGRWGGYFGGSYANDEMHYDLEPTAWTAAGNWEKGLYPQYASFGKKGDVGKGMGAIASYKLPATGTVLASLETPVQAAQPVAVAVNTQPVARTPAAPAKVATAPVQVASIAPVAPVAKPVVAPAAQPVVQPVALRRLPVQQAAMQWKVRPARAQMRQRYESDEDTYTPTEARERVRYAQAQRYGRRSGGRAMRDYGDD